MELWIRETWINETKGHIIGDTEWYETGFEKISSLFRKLQREYGKCISKLFTSPNDRQIGWVFQKTAKYIDTKEPYVQLTWIEVSTTQPRKYMQWLNVNPPFKK